MDDLKSLRITVPHMGRIDLAYARVLERRGVQVIVPPRPNARSLKLGSQVSPEFACLPFKLNMGNMIEALERGANTILTYGGCGPCRFGYYGCLQEEILKDLGYQFVMGTTDDPDQMSSTLATIRQITGIRSRWEAFKIFYFMMKRLSAADQARKMSLAVRPRERKANEASEAYQKALARIDATSSAGELRRTKRKIRRMFSSIPLTSNQTSAVKIGIVGELFMVEEPNANFELEEKLGRMGAQVERGIWLSEWLNERFHFEPWRRAKTKRAKRLARGYLEHSAGGESLISVGGAIDFARKGFDGVVHLMPFTCMPEIVAQGILTRVSRDFSLPVLTLIIDEHTTEVGVNTRLEAFVDLLRARKGKNPGRRRGRPAAETQKSRSQGG
jgi:predicted nucleotide-binding protein (sugar kinase/HSP70/actin superfamily)